uniref:Uncharacterized protein n=1 Tax=Anguilla anguilla TaxID=7936 RepID=A0A0E9RSM6_ANGAN
MKLSGCRSLKTLSFIVVIIVMS